MSWLKRVREPLSVLNSDQATGPRTQDEAGTVGWRERRSSALAKVFGPFFIQETL